MTTPSLYFHGVHLGDFITPEMSKKNKTKGKTPRNGENQNETPRRRSDRKRNRTDKGKYYDEQLGESVDEDLVSCPVSSVATNVEVNDENSVRTR